jgi:large conductance mechanosensitive channel
LAAAFTTLVTSFVSEILLPPLSLLPFMNKNMDEKFAVLRAGLTWAHGVRYNTMKQALDDGAVILAYGYVPRFSPPRPVIWDDLTWLVAVYSSISC